MSGLISREALIATIQHETDMQDLYLPVHFINLIKESPAVDPIIHANYKYCPHCGEKLAEAIE